MGPKKARLVQQEEGAVGGEDDGGVEPELDKVAEDASLQELQDMLRTHMALQQAAGMEQEATRQESRWKALQHQFSLLQHEVHVRTTPDPAIRTEPAQNIVLDAPARGSSAMSSRLGPHRTK